MIGRNDCCWCGSKKKWKKCHYPERSPEDKWASNAAYYQKNYCIRLKQDEQIEGIRKACRVTADILKQVCEQAVEGVSTNELNALAEQLHQEAGATAASYHYGNPPFPKSICTSLNEVICHGIPNDDLLKSGDILNVDVSSIVNGYYGDCSKMVCIGNVDVEKQLVCSVSYDCLMKAIKVVKPGVMLSRIGEVIHDHASSKGCSVVYQFVGHGVGLAFHEPPQIPHYRNNTSIPLEVGMTFTIEPMINAGVAEGVFVDGSDWVVVTKDGKPSAQWEHTLLVTPTGCEVLTSFVD